MFSSDIAPEESGIAWRFQAPTDGSKDAAAYVGVRNRSLLILFCLPIAKEEVNHAPCGGETLTFKQLPVLDDAATLDVDFLKPSREHDSTKRLISYTQWANVSPYFSSLPGNTLVLPLLSATKGERPR